MYMQRERIAGAAAERASPIGVAVVADRDVTRGALLGLVSGDPDLVAAGSAADPLEGEALLADSGVHVVLVNLSLAQPPSAPTGVDFIRTVKARRPDVGVLSLKRDVDEPHLRAALDAGADACCMATTSGVRLLQAIKAVAAGATWLDPEISRILLHPVRQQPASVPHLSPREGEILRLLTDGYTNEEIADRLLCAPATVKTHLLHLFRKLGVNDRVSAAVSALRNGLL
jgi:NarL family two-component system response regulator LiaR